MKLRPHFDLRFRDAEQFMEVQELAKKSGISMNEWLIRKIEATKVVKK
jgi:predicted HicB family RNase H-like nuclease